MYVSSECSWFDRKTWAVFVSPLHLCNSETNENHASGKKYFGILIKEVCMVRHDWFRENSMTLWIARQIPDHFDPFPFENLLFLYLLSSFFRI